MERWQLQQLRDLPIEGVAERLGLQVDRHKALCPFHDDHHASLSFSLRRNTYRCFVCGAAGGTIDLVMRCLNASFLSACQWLGGESLPLTPSHRGGIKVSPIGGDLEGAGFDASRYERFFEHPWLNDDARRFLFEERRLDPRVVSWCRITSWRDRHGTAWLQTPYYDQDRHLIGIQNRRLTKTDIFLPRFRFPRGSRCSVYNLPVLKMLRPGEELWITEGCSDCWAMLSSGKKAIAIPSATLLTPGDAEMLSALCTRLGTPLHMYPDRDEPGERLFLQLQQMLHSAGSAEVHSAGSAQVTLEHHQLPPDCKDYSELYLKNHLEKSREI